ncbi:MAG TPA: TIGR03790 family protein [Chthoniobacterales bacterium]|nr:TIGR03790 family protein [Chthoniobacterales bacterium]
MNGKRNDLGVRRDMLLHVQDARKRVPPLVCIAVLVVVAFSGYAHAEQPLAPTTIVVFNSNDRESVELAKFYAQKRGIARDHLVALACSRDEEITRDEYDRTIAGPLRETFRERNWWTLREAADGTPGVSGNRIRFVAVIRGIPLKIRAAEAYPGDKVGNAPIGNRNEASVDSELSILARFSPEISGAVSNPYFQSYRAIAETENAPVMLVCRLDAPSAQTVRRMINDAVETEKNGLWGRAFVDGAANTGGGLEVGDRWLAETMQQLRKSGVPVVYDEAQPVFPEGYPVSDCAVYYGWYSDRVAGPFAQHSFRFTPGAVAVHIHSYSASTLRDPTANWVGPLLTQGAAASLGNVYEPFLQLTTNLSIMNDRLLHGFTFAESAYMGTPAVSWMQVMVGDPLYRPYASWLQLEPKAAPVKTVPDWKLYHDFAVQNASRPPADFRTLARQVASRVKNGPMIEDLGLMEARDGKWSSATAHFQQARSIYTKREDILRSVLHEANSWAKQGKPRRGADVVRSVLRIVSDAPTIALFKKIEQELNPPPAAPSPAR